MLAGHECLVRSEAWNLTQPRGRARLPAWGARATCHTPSAKRVWQDTADSQVRRTRGVAHVVEGLGVRPHPPGLH